MKVLILGDTNSVHIIKWVKALSLRGIEIGLFSLAAMRHSEFDELPNFTFKSLQLTQGIFKSGEGSFQKLSYLKALPILKAFIRSFQPDILHSHYASSYGFLGSLANFHPFIVSVWGSDVYDFPQRNFIFKYLLRRTLRKADQLLSTSHVMAKETLKYTKKPIIVTPFGVDLTLFKPSKLEKSKKGIVLGTIKALEHKYGIDILIKAFAIIVEERADEQFDLEIYGTGTDLENLRSLCRLEGVEDKVHFHGSIPNQEVPKALNNLDIYLALSRWDSESFGVAIVEAQACGIPVIVSNKGGLPEVVKDGTTGIVVESENIQAIVAAIHYLLDDVQLMESMGEKGQQRAHDLYNWTSNVENMIEIYTSFSSKKDEK